MISLKLSAVHFEPPKASTTRATPWLHPTTSPLATLLFVSDSLPGPPFPNHVIIQMGSRRPIILPAPRMLLSAFAVGLALPASAMASASKDNIFFEEHAQIQHGEMMIAQATAKAVGH